MRVYISIEHASEPAVVYACIYFALCGYVVEEYSPPVPWTYNIIDLPTLQQSFTDSYDSPPKTQYRNKHNKINRNTRPVIHRTRSSC